MDKFINNILAWYQKCPLWVKILLAVPMLFVFVVGAWFLLGANSTGRYATVDVERKRRREDVTQRIGAADQRSAEIRSEVDQSAKDVGEQVDAGAKLAADGEEIIRRANSLKRRQNNDS